MRLKSDKNRGFSLIELMVSVALFSTVMLVSMGSLLALASANRKAQALQSVMNNLNTAVDGMVRSIRMGSLYHCGSGGVLTDPASCDNGGEIMYFEEFEGSSGNPSDQWAYQYDSVSKRMYKSEDSGLTWFALTAPEIQVEEAKFFVVGASNADLIQPKVVIILRGTAGGDDPKTRTTFSVQSTAVQRAIDI